MSEPRPTPAPLDESFKKWWRIGGLYSSEIETRPDLARIAFEAGYAAALAPPPPAAPHGYVPTREDAIADITYVRNMLQWHQEKSVQWVPEIEKLNYALEYLAATLPGSTPECQGQLIEGGYFVCPRCGPGHVSECGAALPASAPAKGRVSECVAHGVLACEVCLTDEAFRAASPLAPALPETE